MGQVDAIVAGAGIWGCTVARVLAEKGRKVLVLEKRPHVGGNVRCETDPETGIEVHTYGSHIFHTHIDRVWDFVRRFVEFNGYQHKVLARHAGKTYFLPLGLTLVNQLFVFTHRKMEFTRNGECEKVFGGLWGALLSFDLDSGSSGRRRRSLRRRLF